MTIVPTEAGDIFYAERGAGPALLCIHGAGGAHRHWGFVLRDLSGVARVLALDLPGHGRSALPGRTEIGAYGAALLALMDALGLERAALAGHSMGGAVALWVALHAPSRVSALGLVGTGGRLRVNPALLETLEQDPPAAVRRIVEWSYPPGTPADLRARAEADYARCDPAVFRGDLLACDRFDLSARLGEICIPAAVVVGEADRMTPPKYAQALQAAIPGAQLTLLPNTGHMAPLEQPAAVSAALRHVLK
ncbi:MAG TPA: alpha/beta fold hydrolase [Roseiflexaceae bacterium]|nr:alpha/beta fold hydrolase [Roseiflexaceae bacterium]